MRLKICHLEVFNALFEAGSVSRAALRLNLSQPAVSVALGKLEEEFGMKLFHRDRGFFAPTREAVLLREEVRHGLAALTRIDQRADEIRAGAAGAISVATNGAMSVNFLPGLIAGFQKDNPGIRINLHVRSSRRVASMVASRQVDIGLIDAPMPVAGLEGEQFRMECVCVMQADDPLAAQEVITPQLLDGRRVIGVTGDHSVDRQFEDQMVRADAVYERSCTSFFYALARNMVAAGSDVSIIDPVNGKAELNDGTVWRKFEPAIYHDLVVITHRGEPLGIAAKLFLDELHRGLRPYSEPNNGNV
ncbi:LysR family transcriptional regulator [Roseovarius sp. C7]|uniref:LysR family transcriptional regulator n=1 Tax=Roseovarius sp. C7 TaxID=3398643 RepID=UPI0039F6B3E5